MAQDKNLPQSGETPDLQVTIGGDGFIRRKQKQTSTTSTVMSRSEKQRTKLLNLRWAMTEASKIDPEIMMFPSYGRVPSRDEILRSKYGVKAGVIGKALLEKHTELIASFVSDVKADSELVLIWAEAEAKVAIEAQATDLMVEYGLGGEEFQKFRTSSVAVEAAVKTYNDATSVEGTTVKPKEILEARRIRDKAILKACQDTEHLVVLHMDYGMLPAKYTRRQDFSQVQSDRKLVAEKKMMLLKAYRQSAIDSYNGIIGEKSDNVFKYDVWNKEFLDSL